MNRTPLRNSPAAAATGPLADITPSMLGTVPHGRRLRVVGTSRAADPNVDTGIGGSPAESCSLSEFLTLGDADGESRRRFAAIELDVDCRSFSPFAVLEQCAALIVNGGALLYRCFARGVPGSSDRSRARYFAALARHYGFADESSEDVVLLRKEHTPRWHLSAAPNQDDACRALFHRVFGNPISPESWQWKYGDGRGRSVTALRQGRLIAHYGGTTRRVAFRGKEVLALQACDVMVDPAERAVMTRQGAFFQVASAWLEAYFGCAREHLLAFGFPNRRALQLGEKLGLYAQVAQLAELNWSPLEPKRSWASHAVRLDPGADHAAVFAVLWRNMRPDMADRILVIRDAAYLSYRYQANPQFRYELVAIRRRLTGTPLALVVLRREDQACRLLDYVGALREIPRALAHTRRLVGLWGLPRLTAWTTADDAPIFAATEAAVNATDVCVPCNAWSESPAVEEIRGRWWLMMGDTDFL